MELQAIYLKDEGMPSPLQQPAQLGCVCSREGRFRAEFKAKESEKVLRFEGPWCSSEELAQDDLLTIRAAAHPIMTRAAALQAMELQAIHLKDDAKGEGGGIEAKKNQYRARVRYIDSSGACRVRQGPARHTEARAQADLEAMRKEAAGEPARAEKREAMSKEARRLQEHSAYEAQIAMAIGKDKFDRQHMQTDSETEPEQDPEAAIHEEPFPGYDVSTPEARERLFTRPLPRKKPQKESPPADSFEATKRLAQFRPVRSDVADLRVLLEARADPNVILGPGDISPLRNVMTFARACDVHEMRLLLLEYGAKESEADKEQWESRKHYDMIEPAWMANFHRDDREG